MGEDSEDIAMAKLIVVLYGHVTELFLSGHVADLYHRFVELGIPLMI
jgi:hypothetical protein